MADVKISALPAASVLDEDDIFPVVQVGSVFKADCRDVGGWLADQGRWVEGQDWVPMPEAVSRIAINDTAMYEIGLPLKYAFGGTTYYGYVRDVGVDSYIDIGGATLAVGTAITSLFVGNPSMIFGLPILSRVISTSTILWPYVLSWTLAPAYLVGFSVGETGNSTHSGTVYLTNSGAQAFSGVPIPITGDAWLDAADPVGAVVSASAYRVQYGNTLRLSSGSLSANSGTGYHVGLCTFVFED